MLQYSYSTSKQHGMVRVCVCVAFHTVLYRLNGIEFKFTNRSTSLYVLYTCKIYRQFSFFGLKKIGKRGKYTNTTLGRRIVVVNVCIESVSNGNENKMASTQNVMSKCVVEM